MARRKFSTSTASSRINIWHKAKGQGPREKSFVFWGDRVDWKSWAYFVTSFHLAHLFTDTEPVLGDNDEQYQIEEESKLVKTHSS